jgi:hypothetical protein
MNLPELQALINTCRDIPVSADGVPLLDGLQAHFPGRPLHHLLTRGGWHRLGGVVDANLQRITPHIATWAEEESDGDLEALVERYRDAGYLVTRLAGKTHYLVVSLGEGAEAFVQLEVEELHEEVERRLIEPGWMPEDLEEFLDPLGYRHLPSRPVGPPAYLFRRLFRVPDLLAGTGREGERLRRFFSEWDRSSAARQPLCHHWALAVRESKNRFGELTLGAKPFPALAEPPPLPADLPERHGMALANALGEFDRAAGFPFAWYFYLVAVPAIPDRLAEQVHQDHLGEYDYLPARDLAILREWIAKPYSL